MKHSYFIITSVHLDYPLYIAFNGNISVTDMRDHAVVWTVIRHITTLRLKDFFVDKCSCKEFRDGLVKIDFTYK